MSELALTEYTGDTSGEVGGVYPGTKVFVYYHYWEPIYDFVGDTVNKIIIGFDPEFDKADIANIEYVKRELGMMRVEENLQNTISWKYSAKLAKGSVDYSNDLIYKKYQEICKTHLRICHFFLRNLHDLIWKEFKRTPKKASELKAARIEAEKKKPGSSIFFSARSEFRKDIYPDLSENMLELAKRNYKERPYKPDEERYYPHMEGILSTIDLKEAIQLLKPATEAFYNILITQVLLKYPDDLSSTSIKQSLEKQTLDLKHKGLLNMKRPKK